MKKLVKRSGYISLLVSIAFLVLGIIIINNPENTIKVVCYILGGLFITFGIVKIITCFYSRDKFAYYDSNLMVGSLCILIGLVIFIFGNAIASILGIIFGIWIVLTSVNRINLSFKIKEAGVKYWYLCLMLSLLVMASGLYVVFSPEIILVTLGTIIIIYSIMDIIQGIIFIVNTNKIFKE